MKTMKKFGSVLGVLAVLTLGACATNSGMPYPPNPNVASQGYNNSGYGVVQSIEVVRGNNGIAGSSVGLGTIAGAVVGGIVGNQIGAGRGNTVATVAGAAGGAYVGHQLENRQQQNPDAYRVTVNMEDGSYQSLMQSTNTDLRVGDRVRVDNGVVQRY